VREELCPLEGAEEACCNAWRCTSRAKRFCVFGVRGRGREREGRWVNDGELNMTVGNESTLRGGKKILGLWKVLDAIADVE
jgi:hypothetical protein